MRTYADLKWLRAAGEQLERQIAVLQQLYEETVQAEEKIKYMSYTDKTKQALAKSKGALDENIRVLTLMARVIHDALLSYNRTEEQIVDHYNLDVVIYPKTRFDTSRITGLEDYRSLMPF